MDVVLKGESRPLWKGGITHFEEIALHEVGTTGFVIAKLSFRTYAPQQITRNPSSWSHVIYLWRSLNAACPRPPQALQQEPNCTLLFRTGSTSRTSRGSIMSDDDADTPMASICFNRTSTSADYNRLI
ncbi:hypothetical protein OPQ81_011088 [Rhizoctonia solani]|nr:hypothetical protein OPQ81_011088 [Rhizoctonia solani]